jgi:3-hydroxyisobutyrate dehydrogenase-like beta-hydroxyacid dehydrogenase
MAATDSRGENVRVAVLGTGIMGSAMARNLASAGLRTTVWDGRRRRPRRCPMPER